MLDFIKERSRQLTLISAAIAVLAVVVAVVFGQKKEENEDPSKYLVRYEAPVMKYGTVFNDLNPEQLAAAQQFGIKERPATRTDVEGKNLVLLEETKDYVIDKLDYSIPYLTKNAKKELDRIGEAFRAKLKENGLPKYQFTVTSVLRTDEDVKNLRKVNVNASANSAHCYGTTWDISYYTFRHVGKDKYWMDPDDLRKVLAEVLREEQEAGRLYVKYERKESCFHMTSRQ